MTTSMPPATTTRPGRSARDNPAPRILAALGALVVVLGLVLTFSKVGGTTTQTVTRSVATNGGGTSSAETPAAFLNMLASAIRSGDVQFMVTRLNPAVIAAYGSSACRKTVATYTGSDGAFSIGSTGSPTAYSYTVDGKTRIVPDTITGSGDVHAAGQGRTRDDPPQQEERREVDLVHRVYRSRRIAELDAPSSRPGAHAAAPGERSGVVYPCMRSTVRAMGGPTSGTAPSVMVAVRRGPVPPTPWRQPGGAPRRATQTCQDPPRSPRWPFVPTAADVDLAIRVDSPPARSWPAVDDGMEPTVPVESSCTAATDQKEQVANEAQMNFAWRIGARCVAIRSSRPGQYAHRTGPRRRLLSTQKVKRHRAGRVLGLMLFLTCVLCALAVAGLLAAGLVSSLGRRPISPKVRRPRPHQCGSRTGAGRSAHDRRERCDCGAHNHRRPAEPRPSLADPNHDGARPHTPPECPRSPWWSAPRHQDCPPPRRRSDARRHSPTWPRTRHRPSCRAAPATPVATRPGRFAGRPCRASPGPSRSPIPARPAS